MTRSILQTLYDHEINVSIKSFWDGGFDIAVGDEINGFDAQTTVRAWAEVEPWFRETAKAKWPAIQFD